MGAIHQTEIRFEMALDEVAVLDGFVQATGKSRAYFKAAKKKASRNGLQP